MKSIYPMRICHSLFPPPNIPGAQGTVPRVVCIAHRTVPCALLYSVYVKAHKLDFLYGTAYALCLFAFILSVQLGKEGFRSKQLQPYRGICTITILEAPPSVRYLLFHYGIDSRFCQCVFRSAQGLWVRVICQTKCNTL